MKKIQRYVFLLLLLFFPVSVFAQDFQSVPITPFQGGGNMQDTGTNQEGYGGSPSQLSPLELQYLQRKPFLQTPQSRPGTRQLQQQYLQQVPEMKPSELEKFVSGDIIEISESQFKILSKFEGIAFRHDKRQIAPAEVAIAVKVVARQSSVFPEEQNAGSKFPGMQNHEPKLIDAGYLIGKAESIGTAFTILGIQSRVTISTDLRQFGYDLFDKFPSTFAPAENVPVGPDYVIGPGDEIKTTVWGNIDGQWNLVVDRDGNISVPKLGVIGVTGLTFKELKDALYKAMSKNYTGFEMNVTMGALRTIRVYMVGNARSPGVYTVSSLSTLVNALFEAGGPSKVGTMRDIQLKRNGKTIVHFDLYDFLIKGDKSKDVRILPEDVIFIPSTGRIAAIAGNVNNPAIYELKDEKTIAQLVEMAGGVNAIAFMGRVQIERIVNGNRQTVFESDIDSVRDKEIPVQTGDIVKIFHVVQDKKIVKLSGAVQRSGDYGFSPGMTVKDLIEKAGGLKYFAFTKEAELTRVSVTDAGPVTEKIKINLEGAIAGGPGQNIPLKEDDYLFVRPVPEWQLYRLVTVTGEVNFPGNYTFEKGERLSSVLERAGGFTDKAYLKGAVFTRPSVKELQSKQLGESIDRIEQQVLATQLGESQTALNSEEAAQEKTVLAQQKAFLAKMRSVEPKGRLTLKIDSLDKLKGSFYDIELEEGDAVFIPKDPQSVSVMGSVYNPTAFVYSPDTAVSDYIAMAGGMTEDAAKSDIFILKADGSAISKRQGGGSFGWNSETKRLESGSFMSTKLDPGDTVIVPPELQKSTWLRDVKDITQILYQIAVTAGVLLLAHF